MSDRPANPSQNVPDKPKYTGGWAKPAVPAAWQPTLSPASAGSITVPTLPKDKAVTPMVEGGWHLPQRSDTVYTTQDMTQISARRMEAFASRPEDIVLTLGTTEEETESAETAEPEPLKPGIEETDTEPSEPDQAALNPASLLELEQVAANVTPSPTDSDGQEDDGDAFSMSELIALSSLVEQTPKSDIVPTLGSNVSVNVADLSPAERAAMQATGQQTASDSEALSQTGADDPAAYARRQLEQLNSGTSQPASPSQSTDDPAAYARRQLEQLGLGTSQPAVAPISPIAPIGTPSLTPQQQEIANRFRQTENQVRALRASYQAGQLNQDQLRDELKKLMILDENNNWWMMGVETDTWYRFDNNTWVLATPPYLAAQPGRSATPPTLTSDLDPNQVIQGSLPYFPSQPVQAQPGDQTQITWGAPVGSGTGGYGITEELGLPRTGIPIEDPDATLVGTIGTSLPPVRPSDAETMQNTARVSAATVVNPRVDMGQYGQGVPSPIEDNPYAETAPDYALEAAPASATYEEILQKQRQQTVRTLLTIAALGVGAVILLMACGIGYILITYNNIAGQYQPQIAALANYQPQFQTARILDVNGNTIAELNSQEGGSRTTVPLDKISPFMIHAVVSLENERFYDDPGWDWIAIGRAFIQNISAGQIESGASTITQQIAEQLILKQSTNTAQLKLDEIVIASQIAQNPKYDKNFILQLYLNEVYFGNQSYGVEAASQFYFHHSANDLTLPEAAMLAGMISSPVQYNPVRSGDDTQTSYDDRRNLTFQRMDTVIARMQEVNCLQFQHAPYLTQPFCVDANVVRQARVDKARVLAATYEPREVQFKYPHFVQFVQALVERDFGSGELYRRGFVVKTTLNPAIQDVAQAALQQTMQNLIVTGVNTGSVMVTDPRTGAIRAMVGSPDFNNVEISGQVNGALTWQQPGSAIKPVVYTAALEGLDSNGDGRLEYLTPASILWDVPTIFQGNYQPVNFDGQFHGPVALRYALQNSYNIPAIKTYQFIGDAKFKDVAGRMGLTFPDTAQFGLPTGIGATEVTLYGMMSAYGTLANGGQRAALYAIESITDSAGNPVNTPQHPQITQAIQPQVAYLMDDILSDDPARATAFGTNGNLVIQGLATRDVVAAKTGTTNDARDLWTVGFTQNAVVGVWLGRPDNNPTNVRDGGYGSAAPLWNRVMVAALQTMQPPPSAFVPPSGLIQQQICADTGTLPAAGCSSLRTEYFLQNQPPPGADQSLVQQIAIDTWTGLRANSFCPDNQVNVTVLNISDTSAIQWLTTPAGAQFAQRLGVTPGTQATIPQGQCDTNTEVPIARIISPTDQQTISGLVQITGAASAQTFNRYQLEVAPASAPNNFTQITDAVTVPQTSGLLGQWNTASVPNGTYILRLAMFSNSGGNLYRPITVNVNNIAPTPVPLVTSPPIDNGQGTFATPAPLPFDQVTPP